MSVRRTEPGAAVTFVIEVGPLIHYGFGKDDIARMESRTKRGLDQAARAHLRVGQRSKVVRTTVRRDDVEAAGRTALGGDS